MAYRWYKFKCMLFGHTRTCCPNIYKRCSKCNFPREAAIITKLLWGQDLDEDDVGIEE